MSQLKAPNGKPSNLTPEQWKLVRTPQFKAWFGFWEENLLIDNFFSKRNFVMGNGMTSSISDSKILNSIISLIPIDVMNKFGSEQLAIDMLFHNVSMFVDVLSLSQRDSFVIPFMNESIIFITITRAKLSNAKPTSSNTEVLLAINTLQDNLIFVINNFAFSSKFSTLYKVSPFAIVRAKFFVDGANPTLDAIIHSKLISDKDKEYYTTLQTNSLSISKVVDENGEPMVVYHGTNKNFNVFKIKKNAKDYNPYYVSGMWFFADPIGNSLSKEEREYFYQEGNAKSMAENWVDEEDGILNVLECFLNVRNPIEVDGYAEFVHWKNDKAIQKSIKNKKRDGWFIHGSTTDGGEYRDDINVFNPEQIKLADGSNTTFDGNNPDIRFAEGGTTNYGVDELYDIATRTFIGLGYDVTQGSNSKTDYGHSRYFYVNQDNKADVNSGLGFQVRVSDHSTGDRRILNGEQFIFDNKDVMEVFNRINYWFHPEEYKNVVAVKTKVVQIEVGENDLQSSDEIISERVAKSGNKRYTIKRTYKNEGVVPTHKFSGYKLPFKPNNPDFRFAEGGKTKRYMKKIKRGGITYGKSHAEGGIPVKNQSTGDMLEVEGGEGIVNKRSMASKSRVKLNGKEMTICEAVSQLNQMEGGVKFSCEDVSDRQFIKAMAKGGELERGTRTEQEHIQVLKDLYAKRITPKQASERIAKDHLKEDSQYYSKLAKMEGKMAKGGKTRKNAKTTLKEAVGFDINSIDISKL